jgi:hypothetical protein
LTLFAAPQWGQLIMRIVSRSDSPLSAGSPRILASGASIAAVAATRRCLYSVSQKGDAARMSHPEASRGIPRGSPKHATGFCDTLH